MNTRKNGMRREFKDAIKDYVKSLAHKMVVHHYIVTVWENEETDTMFAVELDLARAAAKQWGGQLWEIIPNDGTTGAIARARG